MVDHALPCAMQSLDILLLDCLFRNKRNVRLSCGRADCLGVITVILLPPHERFDVLGADDLDLMAQRLKFTRPAKCALQASTAIVHGSN